MNVVGIALRSLRHRALSTALTALGVALGVGLSLAVSTGVGATRKAYFDAARGYDVVLAGPKTTPTSAVLNAVFHRDRPVDTVPKSAYEDARKDPRVLFAVPCAVGDTHAGFRVVGTKSEFFDAIPDAKGRPLRERLAPGGRVFGDAAEFEAVVGSFASTRGNLPLGAEFTVRHGYDEPGAVVHEHKERWRVVGVLEATGTPNDQAIFVTLGSFFEIAEHQRGKGAPRDGARPSGGDEMPARSMDEPSSAMGADEPGGMSSDASGSPGKDDPDDDHGHDGAAGHDHLGAGVWAVSTVLVRLKSPAFRIAFAQDWNRRADVSAAVTSDVVASLFQIVSGVDEVLAAIAALVLAVAGLSILSALYNSIQGRRREIAILRALGARRLHVFSVVVLEAVLVCVLGGVVGVALGHLAVAGAAPTVMERFGVRIDTGLASLSRYAQLLGALVGIGVVAGAIPAWRAYRVPVARNLSPVD